MVWLGCGGGGVLVVPLVLLGVLVVLGIFHSSYFSRPPRPQELDGLLVLLYAGLGRRFRAGCIDLALILLW